MNEKIFSERLKIARQKADFSQAELSRKTGIASATLSSYEKGKMPPIDKAFEIAEALNVSLDWLCGKQAVSERVVINFKAKDYLESLAIVLSEINTELEFNQEGTKAVITITQPEPIFYCKRVDELLRVYESGLFSDEMYTSCIEKLCSEWYNYSFYFGNLLTEEECFEAIDFFGHILDDMKSGGVITTTIGGRKRSLLLSYDDYKELKENSELLTQ